MNKLFVFLLTVWLFLSCGSQREEHDNSEKQSTADSTPIVNPSNNPSQKQYLLPDTIGGKPVTFYLYDTNIAPIAKALYLGQFIPTDNDSTTQLLSYAITNDSIVRPFYRWCLDFTIQISDGALAEYPGAPALQYATRFPNEFFAYMDKDKSAQRYKQWTEIIAYSGLYNYKDTPDEIRKQVATEMLGNCHPCSDSTKKRIDKFITDITDAVKLQD